MEVTNLMDVGLLLLRLVIGFYLFGHGSQKLFGWFGGGGMAQTEGGMQHLGFRPARIWALSAGLTEAVGGLLLALGLLNPLGSLAIAATMLVAIPSVHLGRGLFATTGGPELPLTNLAAVLALGLAGPGRFSLDSWLGFVLPEPLAGVVVGVLVLLGAALALATRRPVAKQQAAQGAS
jgi:putative oxidoreductase